MGACLQRCMGESECESVCVGECDRFCMNTFRPLKSELTFFCLNNFVNSNIFKHVWIWQKDDIFWQSEPTKLLLVSVSTCNCIYEHH